MHYKLTPVFFLLACLPLGCSEQADSAPDAEADELTTALLGTWETVELKVEYATYGGQDTAVTEHIREADWGRLYGVRPPSTVFTPDGKLRRTNRMKTGEVTNVTNGIWKQRGDSLFIIEPNVTYTYLHRLEDDLLTLTGTIDLDRDGETDDNYYAVYRLVSRTQ